MKKTLLTLAAGAGAVALLASCQSSSVAYPGGEEEAIMMSDATDPGVIPPWASEEDVQVSAGATTEDRNNYAIPEGPVASTSQNQPKVSSQNQPEAATQDGNDVMVENDPLASLGTPVEPTPRPTARPSTGRKGGAGKGGKSSTRRISNAKPTLVTYKVRPGDNLTVIAKRSNTTVEQIRKDSKLKGDVIRPGQIIKVRYTPKGYKAPATGGKKGSKGSTGTAAKGSVTVKKGDSLSAIAARQGVTVAELKAANGIKGDTIRAGQKLTIPSKASSSKKATSKKKSSRRKR
ncbi:MAG: LysM peptidoglycan-binding domain-containing protein [Akkermansia sp.]|nr:LysM peptidoglycan-binding domain-containing protein [Akkermansia sp.]